MEEGKRKVGLIDTLKIMRMFKGMYARVCPMCRQDLVTLVMQHSIGQKDLTVNKQLIEKCKEVTCNKCKDMIIKYMQNIQGVMRDAAERQKDKGL